MKQEFVLTKTSICEYLRMMCETLTITPLERFAVQRLYLECSLFPPVDIVSVHPSADMIDVRAYLIELFNDSYLPRFYRSHVEFDIDLVERLWCNPDAFNYVGDENTDDNAD